MSTLSTILANVLENPAFAALVIAALAALGGVIGKAIVGAWGLFRTALLHRLDAAQMAIVDSIAARAVRYAEQVIDSTDGQAKLAEASRILAEQAAARGIPLTPEQVRLAIEAAVVDLKVELAPVAQTVTLAAPVMAVAAAPTGGG